MIFTKKLNVTVTCEKVKKHFSKELLMTKKDHEDFENSTKCWICDNDYILIMMLK